MGKSQGLEKLASSTSNLPQGTPGSLATPPQTHRAVSGIALGPGGAAANKNIHLWRKTDTKRVILASVKALG